MSEPPTGVEPSDDDAAQGSPTLSRQEVFSWLGGPRAAVEQAGIELGYRGQRLGYPEDGPGSVATFNRRIAAIFIDWIASLLVARAIEAQFLDSTTVTRAFLPTFVFFLEISVDGTRFTELGRRTEHFSASDPWVAPGRGLPARYVRIRSDQYVTLTEIEVHESK